MAIMSVFYTLCLYYTLIIHICYIFEDSQKNPIQSFDFNSKYGFIALNLIKSWSKELKNASRRIGQLVARFFLFVAITLRWTNTWKPTRIFNIKTIKIFVNLWQLE